MVELHFRPCFLLAAVSFIILCGIEDDCSDGSVVIVLCSSVSELRISDDNVCVGRAFVDDVLGRFILSVLMKLNQLIEALWLGCHCNWDFFVWKCPLRFGFVFFYFVCDHPRVLSRQ